MRALGLRQRLEPIGDLLEAFLARGARHARVHVGVLVRLAGDGSLQIVAGLANRQTCRRIAGGLEKFEMPMCMSGLTLGGGAKYRSHIVETFHVRLLGEIKIAPVRLGLSGESVFQVVLGLTSLECSHVRLLFGSDQRGYLQQARGDCTTRATSMGWTYQS